MLTAGVRLTAALLILGQSGCTISDTTDPPISDFQSAIDWYTADSTIPGAVALVSRGDDVWSGGSGYASLSGEIMNPFVKVRIASLTKLFTATVILQMAEEGRLGLDETIVPFFERGIIDSLVILDGQSYGHRITIRMLLSHRSGVYDYADEEFYELLRADPTRRWQPLDLVRYAINSGQPYFVPDVLPPDEYGYSNTNYIMLGKIAEQIDGRAYHHLVRDRILIPLSLSSTFLAEYEAIPPPLAAGYDGASDVSSYDYSFEWASSGLVGTVGNLHEFMDALMGGRLFQNTSTLEEMKSPGGYGLGLATIITGDGVVGYGHFGQSLGFVSVMAYVPSRDACIIASMNQRTANIVSLYLDLLSLTW
ncbi:beta-lactamase family protein [Candidatus Fermentibacteria bacterium]|nr:beta-lactamase family protein [Candidatus Fermentibacteria bacterium]